MTVAAAINASVGLSLERMVLISSSSWSVIGVLLFLFNYTPPSLRMLSASAVYSILYLSNVSNIEKRIQRRELCIRWREN
jgi:hypothetical protein